MVFKKILFISLFFHIIIVTHQINGQVNSENINKKVFIPNEENPPSLFTPKKESPFLNKDPFNPPPNNNSNEEIYYISSNINDPGLLLKHKRYSTFRIDEGPIREWLFKNIDCKMSRIEIYFQEIDRRIKSGIPFTPPTSSSSRSNSLSNSESDKLSGDDKSSLSPTVLNNEKVWKEVK